MKLLLDTEGLCPASGLTIYGQVVPIHRVNLQALDNGIIMLYCPAHQARCFIADRGVANSIKQGATVIDRLFPKEKKPKEKKNGEA